MGQSTIVKASQTDLGWLKPELEYAAAAEKIVAGGARLVIVTLGSEGAFAVGQNLRVSVEAPTVDVVDTIGAGDGFSAGFLDWLHDHGRIDAHRTLETEQLRAALEFACLAVSLTCAKAGAEPPTRAEIERAQSPRG